MNVSQSATRYSNGAERLKPPPTPRGLILDPQGPGVVRSWRVRLSAWSVTDRTMGAGGAPKINTLAAS